MIRTVTGFSRRWRVIMIMAFVSWPGAAAAQGIGAGPLTATLPTEAPQGGVLHAGPVHLAPGVVVREIGWDSNVFDEAVNPKEDWVVSAAPDVSAFMRVPYMQLAAYGGLDLNYYHTYESERSTGYAGKGRVDFLLSRVRPFAGAGYVKIRERPNGEIDVRANRIQQEWSGGLAYDLSNTSAVYGAAYQTTVRYLDAQEEGVDLGASLNHDRNDYQAGLRSELTPLAALTLSGGYQEDLFHNEPIRNGDTRYFSGTLRIREEAMISGAVSASFRDYRANNPEVKPFRGVTALASLTYSFLEVGRVTFIGSRGMEYSFDSAEAYYLENTITLYYTHRLFGGVDAQVRGSLSKFDYAFSEVTPPHKDQLDVAGASVGYNLANRTRISLNYEFSRRRSPVFPERNYDRRRAYLSWTYAL